MGSKPTSVEPPLPPELRFNAGLSFTDKHAPKPPTLFVEPVAGPAASTAAHNDAFSRYIGDDLRGLVLDVAERPQHYTTEHKDTLERLRRGADTTARDRSDLLLQFVRRTEAQKLERGIRRQQTATEVLGGRRYKRPPPFENQSLFQGAIPW